MDWYYIHNQQQTGPVTEGQLQTLIKDGTLSNSTLVWNAGMTDWKPYQEYQSSVQTTGETKVCSQCSRFFQTEDMIVFNGLHVCAACKPVFFQKIKEGVSPSSGMAGLGRRGNLIIASPDACFPGRCVKCNAPVAQTDIKLRLYYSPPWVYFLLLAGLLFLIIGVLLTQKKAAYQIAVCPVHKNKRFQVILTAWGMFAGSVLLFFLAAAFSTFWPVLAGLLLFLASLIYGMVAAPYLRAGKITKTESIIKGAGPEFLASLPERL
ncbi:MAG: DUF4339 domain-containing protein [Verrucomicrobiae bacterium]|nr:DUF4339 domain-containing protein [Verrucomicrobiae bacterium]